jgi:hypothetical protein
MSSSSRSTRRSINRGGLGLAAALAGLLVAAVPALSDSSLISTTRPELIAAQVITPNVVLVCFDKPLATPFALSDADLFLDGYSEATKTGTGLVFGSAVSSESGYCATVTFTGTGDVRTYSDVTARAGAVNAASGGQGNIQGSVTLTGSTNGHPGLTSGPDLVSFSIDKTTGIVSFNFDAPVSTATGAIKPLDFHVIDSSGVLSSPPAKSGSSLLPGGLLPGGGTGAVATVDSASPDTVEVDFSTTNSLLGVLPLGSSLTLTNDAVGVTVDEGAVMDATTSDLNPIGTLGISAPASTTPGGPTTPPAPPVPSVPPLVIPPPAVKTCVSHRVITIHLLKSVARNLKSATATVNGKTFPVSKKLVITIQLSKYEKVKTVTLKIKGKPKTGHAKITATKVYHPC